MKNNQLNNQNKVCNYIICFDKKHMNTGFQIQIKVRFLYECSDHLSHSKNFHIPISIDISIKTHQFVCIRQA